MSRRCLLKQNKTFPYLIFYKCLSWCAFGSQRRTSVVQFFSPTLCVLRIALRLPGLAVRIFGPWTPLLAQKFFCSVPPHPLALLFFPPHLLGKKSKKKLLKDFLMFMCMCQCVRVYINEREDAGVQTIGSPGAGFTELWVIWYGC